MKRFALPSLMLAALTAIGLPAVATAAPAAATAGVASLDAHGVTPAQRLRTHMEWVRSKRASLPAQIASQDSTPPAVRFFSIENDVDAQSGLPFALANTLIEDDLSGLQTVIVTLVGPSGQMVQRVEGLLTGQRKLDGKLSIGAAPVATVPFSRFSEPGTWTVDSLFISDAAYNMVYLDRTALTGMGRSQFTVHNAGGHDKVGPQMKSGRIDTKRVSLTTPPPGTSAGTLPWLAAGVRMADLGNGVVAGPTEAILAFCLLDARNDCVDRFELQGHVNEFGRPTATVVAGGQPRADQTPGQYILQYVVMLDQAQNMSVATSQLVGGETDFGQYFKGTTITIDP
jgi:hypothetical protein